MGRAIRSGQGQGRPDLGQPVIFDAGVFIALDNPSKRGVVHALMRKMIADGVLPSTNEAVLAQAWRNP